MALLVENKLNDFGHVPSAAGFGLESTIVSMFDDVDANSDSIDDGYWEIKSPLSLSDSGSPHPLEAILDICDLDLAFDDVAQPLNFDSDIEQFMADELHYSPSAAVCDCTALKLKCSAEDISPVLRDCMWSGTSGLVPMIVSADGKPCVPLSSGAGNGSDLECKMGGHIADSCSICTSCVSQTSMSMCVDPKSVFPYPECRPQTTSSVRDEICTTPPLMSSSSTCSAVYDPDSETSAYSSAVSDEEPEEIDVVSVPLSSLNSSSSSSSSSRLTSPTSSPSPRASLADRREMLVLPASESVSAQVAAMHNYSSTRCRPTSSPSSSAATQLTLSAHSLHTIKRKYAKRPVVSAKGRSRHHITTTYSGSDSSEDSWANGDNEDDRCRRAQHNVMERRRRHHLKGNFFRLRDVIPDIAGDGRVSKVAILCRARDYIGRLTASERAMQAEYDQLCAAQSKLKWQLSLVQREQRLTAVSS